jgi:hypothetical protein
MICWWNGFHSKRALAVSTIDRSIDRFFHVLKDKVKTFHHQPSPLEEVILHAKPVSRPGSLVDRDHPHGIQIDMLRTDHTEHGGRRRTALLLLDAGEFSSNSMNVSPPT